LPNIRSNKGTILLSRLQAAIPPTAALLACLAASTFSAPAAAQWLQRGYDAAATYANTAETTLTPANVSQLSRLWRTHAPSQMGLIHGEATESGGLIFDCNLPSVAHARSSTTGSLAWQTALDAESCTTPALGGGRVYMALGKVAQGNTNGLVALDQATGAVLWQSTWPADAEGVNAPALVGDTLYVADRTGNLRAVDANTGAVKWQSQTAPDSLNNATVVAGGRVFVTTLLPWGGVTAPGTYAFDAATGRRLWSRLQNGCSYIFDPAMVLGDRVIIGPCGAGPLTARRASDGKLLWKKDDLPDHPVRPLTGHGNTIFSAHSSYLIAMDADTGLEHWRLEEQTAYDHFLTNLVWANGMLFMLIDKALDDALELRVLDATTGKSLARRPHKIPDYAEPFGNSLTVADGQVQIGYYLSVPGGVSTVHWVAYGLK